MKYLRTILLLTMLPTNAFAWAGYDYVPTAADQQQPAADQQEMASYDPAMQPLDQNYGYEYQGEEEQASTNMPLDAD